MKKSVRSILNGLGVPIMIVDERMRIVFANGAAIDRFALARADVKLSEIFDNPKCLRATQRVLDGDQETQVEVTLQEVVPTSFRVNVAPMTTDKGNEKLNAILSFEDISHIREAEQIRHDFVANVSHELRSPLTALIGFIETLQGPARHDQDAMSRFLKMMDKESDRMARLIDDLLSLSKLQARERMQPTGVVDVADLITSIISTLGGPKESVRDRVKVKAPFEECWVIGEYDELAQVFRNLIENAIKYSAETTDVTISISKQSNKSHACISVKDAGEGIDANHIPRLTERFYRIDKGRSREMGGTGLGLAIVKHILIHHRGWLKIKSQLGVGSEFSVYLPKSVS